MEPAQADFICLVCDLQSLGARYQLASRFSISLINRDILILLALPPDSTQWLICEELELRLKGTCYWEYLSGNLSENRQSVRIRIPRFQRLTPESLLTLMENIKTGEWS